MSDRIELWCDRHPRASVALMLVFLLLVLGIGGWIDAPLT